MIVFKVWVRQISVKVSISIRSLSIIIILFKSKNNSLPVIIGYKLRKAYPFKKKNSQQKRSKCLFWFSYNDSTFLNYMCIRYKTWLYNICAQYQETYNFTIILYLSHALSKYRHFLQKQELCCFSKRKLPIFCVLLFRKKPDEYYMCLEHSLKYF